MNYINKIKIEKFTKEDIKETIGLIKRIYSKTYFDKTNIYVYDNLVDWLFYDGIIAFEDYSIKVIYRKKIIGVMILSDFSLYCLLESYKNEEINKNIEKYKEKNGLKSVFFGVDIKYQKKGIGNKMIEYVKENYNHFDYLLGIQHKAISNMDFFLNRRNVVSEIENSIYTAQELN